MYNFRIKGKEYYLDGKLQFEGEYLNDKIIFGKSFDEKGNIKFNMDKLDENFTGQRKEYDFDYGFLIFEGEYLNGKRNGKGKEYYMNSKLKFEGEYLNGQKQKGKEYYDNGKLKFEGEYLNDLKWNGIGYDNLSNIIYELNDGMGLIK